MPDNQESAPLLGHSDHNKDITFSSSLKELITESYVNTLLIFVPIALVVSLVGASDSTVFLLNFIAIVPLAKLLGFATEELAKRTGATIGALLNATFGNAVELILGVIALKEGLIRVVQASILGSILSNILLVLGLCFLAGYLKRGHDQTFSATAAQTSSSLLSLNVLALLVPAAFASTIGRDEDNSGILALSRGTAVILLIVYVLFLYFQLSTHKKQYEDVQPTHNSRPSSISSIEDDEEEPKTTLLFAVGALLVVAGLVSFHAEFLVGAIEGVVEAWGINETFVGIILLPLVGNAAEHVSAITFAMKNKMNLCIGIALSSSLQIGLLVTPIMVLAGWFIGQPMSLFFENFETVVLFASVMIVNYLIQDSISNWLEGVMLLSAYGIIGLAFYFQPV